MSSRFLAVTGLLALVLTAPEIPNAPSLPGIPSPNQTGNLTINSVNQNGNPEPGTFELFNVTAGAAGVFDFNTANTWQQIVELMKSPQTVHQVTLGDKVNALKIGSTGIGRWSSLSRGLYYVIEIDDDAANLVSSDNSVLALPFIVSIPIFDAESNTWQWTVTATPKKQVCAHGTADLAATVRLDKTTVTVGNQVSYVFTVTNNGPDYSPGATAAITIPPGLGIVNVSASSEFNQTGNTWTIPALADSQSISLTITVAALMAGQHPVTILVSGMGTCDPDSANNYFDPVLTATPVPQPTPTPTAPPTQNPSPTPPTQNPSPTPPTQNPNPNPNPTPTPTAPNPQVTPPGTRPTPTAQPSRPAPIAPGPTRVKPIPPQPDLPSGQPGTSGSEPDNISDDSPKLGLTSPNAAEAGGADATRGQKVWHLGPLTLTGVTLIGALCLLTAGAVAVTFRMRRRARQQP